MSFVIGNTQTGSLEKVKFCGRRGRKEPGHSDFGRAAKERRVKFGLFVPEGSHEK